MARVFLALAGVALDPDASAVCRRTLAAIAGGVCAPRVGQGSCVAGRRAADGAGRRPVSLQDASASLYDAMISRLDQVKRVGFVERDQVSLKGGFQ
jgi:hypothetical protein